MRLKLTTLPGASRLTGGVKLPGGVKVPSAASLLAGAQETAEHMLAAQRKLADQIAHAAAPLLAQGAARAAQAAQAILPGGPSSTRPAADGHAASAWDTAVGSEQSAATQSGTSAVRPASASTTGTSDAAKATSAEPAAPVQPAAAAKAAAAKAPQPGNDDALTAAVASALHVSTARASAALRPLLAAGFVDSSSPAFSAAARSLGVSNQQLSAALAQAKLSMAGGKQRMARGK